MGNGLAKVKLCFSCGGAADAAELSSDPQDEALGHSFCYFFPDPASAKVHSDDPSSAALRCISGASVSANASTPLSTSDLSASPSPAAFDCSASFSSAPIRPMFLSGPIERGFLSGPIERGGSLSGPIGSLSGPKDLSGPEWAQGRAGEDRVHVVVPEDGGWVFVGIYDGFNGPDATDHLLSNLYPSVERELNLINDSLCADHSDVLNALSRALTTTEEDYFEIAADNPELALMGSCVLVLLLKGEDLYIMNVGDSRAVVAQDRVRGFPGLTALQLSLDHNTCNKEEVRRIRDGHRDDPFAVVNGRVKGSLEVTRAFGAGFLKQPKWNNALLEVFRIDYVGSQPYITSSPFLHHHRLGPRDRFLIFSSDGLYQYFTNEEVVAQVELFAETTPEGDPAQHLVEEVLYRAAEAAGMDFHELLEIPQGDRRRYHDDVSIIVISLEGRIWRSCV